MSQSMCEKLAIVIWTYNECPWDFYNPPEGIAQLQKQIALDQAEQLCIIIELHNDKINCWLSAALDDPNVCKEMKQDIQEWFNYYQ